MSYKWDDKLTERFLNLYRKHKCLWNPYSPNYRNCSVKNEAFRIVVQELNVPQITISECLQQIEVVREKYKREQLKAENELKSGNLYTSKIPWFDLMSQMLCEVINDEENFSDDPVRILPCTVTKYEQNKDPNVAIPHGGSPNSLYKLRRYVEPKCKPIDSNTYIISEERELAHVKSVSKKLPDGKSGNNNWQNELANGPWNRCPFCGWEDEKNLDKIHNRARQLYNCKETGVQIDPEVEVPLRFENANNLDASDIGESNLTTPPHLCVSEMNDPNCETRRQEFDVMQNRKKVQINADIEPSRGTKEKYDSMQQKKCNVTEDKVPRRDATKAINPFKGVSSRENDVHCHRMCENNIDDVGRCQFLESQLSNFEITQTDNRTDEPTPNLILYQDTFARQSQKISEFEDETDDGKKDVSTNRYNSCIQEFGERNRKFSTMPEEDKYEVCSRFKIVIPSSDREDQNLEISGYEVRVMNPQLPKYALYPSSGTPEVAIGNAECPCKNEFSVPRKNVNIDSARYSSIIKLDINRKRSKETEAMKRLRSSGTTSTRERTDTKNDCVSGIETQHKSFSNKKTQTYSTFENQSIQTVKDMERREFHSIKSVKDQGCASPSLNGKSCQVTTLNENENKNLKSQHQSTWQGRSAVSENSYSNEKVYPEIDNSSLPVEKFVNTKKFLNIIVKIIDSDDTHEGSEDLQKTLDTMLDEIQHMSMNAQNATEHHVDYNTNDTMYDDTSMSTQYNSLRILESAPVKIQARNISSQKSTNKTVDPVDTTRDSRPQSPILRERINEENENRQPFNETSKSIEERVTKNGPSASLPDDTNRSNSASDSISYYTDEFLNDEPVASSSRKILEHRTPSQLAKDFLDVIKYTMIMDGVQQAKENGNNDCCKKPNRSTDL